jgi:MFS family permease
VGHFADRLGKRYIFVFICYSAIFIGYLIAVAPPSFIPGLNYAACVIAACGIYPGTLSASLSLPHLLTKPSTLAVIPGLLALSSNNYAPVAKRAVGMAIQIGMGSMAGAAASNFYHKTDAPRYRFGHSLVMGFAGLGLATTVGYYLLCRHINKKRDARPADASQYSQQDLLDLGDKSPEFRYKL